MDPLQRLEKKYGQRNHRSLTPETFSFSQVCRSFSSPLALSRPCCLKPCRSFLKWPTPVAGSHSMLTLPDCLQRAVPPSLSCSWLLLENTSSSSSETGLSEHRRTSCFHQINPQNRSFRACFDMDSLWFVSPRTCFCRSCFRLAKSRKGLPFVVWKIRNHNGSLRHLFPWFFLPRRSVFLHHHQPRRRHWGVLFPNPMDANGRLCRPTSAV